MLCLTLVVPIIGSLAILYRPDERLSIERQVGPGPLADYLNLRNPVPEGLPVHASLRTDGSHDLAFLHGSFTIVHFHAEGNLNPLVSVLTSYRSC